MRQGNPLFLFFSLLHRLTFSGTYDDDNPTGGESEHVPRQSQNEDGGEHW